MALYTTRSSPYSLFESVFSCADKKLIDFYKVNYLYDAQVCQIVLSGCGTRIIEFIGTALGDSALKASSGHVFCHGLMHTRDIEKAFVDYACKLINDFKLYKNDLWC